MVYIIVTIALFLFSSCDDKQRNYTVIVEEGTRVFSFQADSCLQIVGPNINKLVVYRDSIEESYSLLDKDITIQISKNISVDN